MKNPLANFNFSTLVNAIQQAHEQMAAQAGRTVNISLTLRNWMIGYYIREYEQNGSDRAKYGNRVLEYLANELQKSLDRCYSARYLRLCRQLYTAYPQIRKSLISIFGDSGKWKSPVSGLTSFPEVENSVRLSQGTEKLTISGDKLVNSLAFTHFVELIKIDEPLKRSFYEIECMRGHWSVRELKRQIGSLYFERTGLSTNKDKLAEMVQAGAEKDSPRLDIRDPYVFEFLGIKSREVMAESDLEDALLDKLQDFLLELGNGFCFEARQKRILIGDTHGFVDLVFYHRVLKCHVLVELKTDTFTHENLGQLNTYLSWYRKNMMIGSDNPPVGILLCAIKNQTLVEYALAGMDNHLFVSRYQFELPSKEAMQSFLEEKMREADS